MQTAQHPTRKRMIEARNETIRNEYQTLFAEGLRTEVICERLSSKYFLQPDTVQRIAFKKDRYQYL